MGSAFGGIFGQLSLERATVQTEQARGLGRVPPAFDEDAVDVLPLDAVERHRLERRRVRLVCSRRRALPSS